jgi:hypothetical protein
MWSFFGLRFQEELAKRHRELFLSQDPIPSPSCRYAMAGRNSATRPGIYQEAAHSHIGHFLASGGESLDASTLPLRGRIWPYVRWGKCVQMLPLSRRWTGWCSSWSESTHRPPHVRWFGSCNYRTFGCNYNNRKISPIHQTTCPPIAPRRRPF